MTDLAVLILAAGRGERMRSQLPKVLHPIAGRPMLARSIEIAKQLKAKKTVVLVGHQADRVRDAFKKENLMWALQKQQLGTAHAVSCGLESLKNFSGNVLILYGDVPLLRPETLQKMKKLFESTKPSLLFATMKMDNPFGYGRVVKDNYGQVERIVEEKEATDDERKIQEVNAGIYLASVRDLQASLKKVKKSIVKGEYYLTDLIEEFVNNGKTVLPFAIEDASEVMGINNRVELARAEAVFQNRLKKNWMEKGVTFFDPDSVRLEADVQLSPDVTIHPGVVITGNSKIESGVEILSHSVIEDSVVKEGARIGPFAHLRPGSEAGVNSHVGNFVELKKTKLGAGAKANHLAYLGDSVIGAKANIGAGTITCNYDGVNKFQTQIGEGAFIGSDTQLVAPVKVGKGAYVGAGTTVTKDVPDGALAVSRVNQKNILGWAKRKK